MVFGRAWQLAADGRYWRIGARRAARGWRPDRSIRLGAALAAARAGFSKLQRLHDSSEFAGVFADSLRSTDRFFTVLGRPNARSIARLGLTISRRAAKRAVDRNRLKRLARESFRKQQELPTWDFVVMAKQAAAAADARTLRESLDQHFQRLANRADRRP